jgi:type IV secretory pathway VirB10-like protein
VRGNTWTRDGAAAPPPAPPPAAHAHAHAHARVVGAKRPREEEAAPAAGGAAGGDAGAPPPEAKQPKTAPVLPELQETLSRKLQEARVCALRSRRVRRASRVRRSRSCSRAMARVQAEALRQRIQAEAQRVLERKAQAQAQTEQARAAAAAAQEAEQRERSRRLQAGFTAVRFASLRLRAQKNAREARGADTRLLLLARRRCSASARSARRSRPWRLRPPAATRRAVRRTRRR